MRSRPPDLLETGAGHAEQRVVHPHDDLADDPQQRRVLQQLVGLVHRARLRVLQRNDAERRLAARHPGEDEPDRVAGQRLGVGERPSDRALAVRARLTLIGDLHGGRA